MQRIRYKEKDGKLISVKPIFSKKGSSYMIYIDIESKTYMIRNQLSLRSYTGGEKINNMNVLKRKVKAHLEQLGCVFGDESRNRSFGLCEKGYTQEKERERRKQEAVSNKGPAESIGE